MTRYRDHRSQRNRRGIEVLELVLVLPILFLTLIAGIQFATTLVVNNTISAAVHEASRLAAMGCDESEISDAVDQFLAAHNLSLGVGTRLVIDNSSSTLFDLGDGSLTSPTVGSALLPSPTYLRTIALILKGSSTNSARLRTSWIVPATNV
jgi:Flp pilus assembly protein TadG